MIHDKNKYFFRIMFTILLSLPAIMHAMNRSVSLIAISLMKSGLRYYSCSADFRSDVIKKISSRAAEQIEGTVNNYENTIDSITYPELVKFVKKYHCSFGDEMIARLTLDQQKTQGITKEESGRHGFQAGATLFVKGAQVERIINAERLKKVMTSYNLDSLRVAEKYTLALDDSVCVLAKKIHGKKFGKISSNEAQQLFECMIRTGYCDWQFGLNVMRDIQGKLVFIDTEDISFISPHCSDMVPELCAHFCSSLKRVQDEGQWPNLHKDYKNNKMELMAEFMKKSKSLVPLPQNIAYDTACGIDFEEVKNETNRLENFLCIQALQEGKIEPFDWL